MQKPLTDMLAVGGKSNSLGRVNEVIAIILADKSRLEELYQCLFTDDAWVRMRAADAIEKICREQPEWIEAYLDRFAVDIATHEQPSIQWHLAQIYRQVQLSDSQKDFAIHWLRERLQSTDVDWIVAANCMSTLFQFVQHNLVPAQELIRLANIQTQHNSKSVVRRAHKILEQLNAI